MRNVLINVYGNKDLLFIKLENIELDFKFLWKISSILFGYVIFDF